MIVSAKRVTGKARVNWMKKVELSASDSKMGDKCGAIVLLTRENEYRCGNRLGVGVKIEAELKQLFVFVNLGRECSLCKYTTV